jgi:hypothetical protein
MTTSDFLLDGAEPRCREGFCFILQEPACGRRVLSGIQPSGQLHLGNLFGAIDQHIAAQAHNTCMFFIAGYHALTTQRTVLGESPKLGGTPSRRWW